uniref:hypothetical protein n=1 Tax=Dematophora necatrix TaxID=2751867 RepID=UPI0030DF8D92
MCKINKMSVSMSPRFGAPVANFLVSGSGSAWKFPGTCRFYSINKRKLHSEDPGNKEINSKLKKKMLLNFLCILICVSLFYSFPLKFLINLCGASVYLVYALSGFIAYVQFKLVQILKDKNQNSSTIEFFKVFFAHIFLMAFLVVLGYPFMISIASLFYIIMTEDLSRLFKDLFYEIFTNKYLYMGDPISPYKVSDKPGKSTLGVVEVLNMDSTAGGSNSTVGGSYTTAEGSNSTSGRSTVDLPLIPGPLPHPLESRCRGKLAKIQMDPTWFKVSISKDMNSLKNRVETPGEFTKIIRRLSCLDEPFILPSYGLPAIFQNHAKATGPNMEYDAKLKKCERHFYSTVVIIEKRS